MGKYVDRRGKRYGRLVAIKDVGRTTKQGEEAINCRYYVPAWEGNKTSGSQPDFCLKHRVVLCGKCIKSCKGQDK